MKEKTYTILLVMLGLLLAISIFLNGWLLHERSQQSLPTNQWNFCYEKCGYDNRDCYLDCWNCAVGHGCLIGSIFAPGLDRECAMGHNC